MKNKGFFLVETAILLLFVFGIMLTTISSYNLCLKNILREQELVDALNCCENVLANRGNLESFKNFDIRTNVEYCNGYSIIDVQVVKNERIIFNVVQIK